MEPDFILTIQDDCKYRSVIEQAIAEIPRFQECVCVADAREAISILSVVTPGYILLDPQVFIKDGFDVVEVVRKMKKNGSIVYILSDQHHVSELQLSSCGADCLLDKLSLRRNIKKHLKKMLTGLDFPQTFKVDFY